MIRNVRSLASTVALGLLTGVLAVPAAGQDTTPDAAPPQGAPGQPALPDSVQEMIQEYQELQNRLGSIQEQAIEQNEELQEERDQLQETVEDAMREARPGVDEDLERMEELQEEMTAAQEAQDREAMMQLSSEAQQLRMDLQEAQSQALENPDVQDEIEAFQDHLMEEMAQVDSETEDLVARLDTLTEQLQEIQQAGPGGAPGAAPAPND